MIFTGQRSDETVENCKNEMSDFFKRRGICIELTSKVYDHLNLDLDTKFDDQINLPNGRALIKLGDRIAYW